MYGCSRLNAVSTQSWCMYVLTVWSTLVGSWVEVNKRTSLITAYLISYTIVCKKVTNLFQPWISQQQFTYPKTNQPINQLLILCHLFSPFFLIYPHPIEWYPIYLFIFLFCAASYVKPSLSREICHFLIKRRKYAFFVHIPRETCRRCYFVRRFQLMQSVNGLSTTSEAFLSHNDDTNSIKL